VKYQTQSPVNGYGPGKNFSNCFRQALFAKCGVELVLRKVGRRFPEQTVVEFNCLLAVQRRLQGIIPPDLAVSATAVVREDVFPHMPRSLFLSVPVSGRTLPCRLKN
jgi:hypothetical protein